VEPVEVTVVFAISWRSDNDPESIQPAPKARHIHSPGRKPGDQAQKNHKPAKLAKENLKYKR
jgi:hypothetical protein